jgi:glycosyltransferase involved in cell wall biosynthesis
VLAPSAATAAELERDYGAVGVGVVPNATGGLPLDAETPGSTGSGMPTDEVAFLFVGRLRVRKGVEVLLEAIARVRASGQAAALWIAGDGEHRAALARRAAQLGLGEEGVRFLGRVSAAGVRALLARAVALVVPSTYEGMPLVVLEAMASAKPVIASRVSGIPEVVVEGETGWLVDPEDPAALAGVLEEALADAEEGRRRGRAGQLRAQQRYRPEQVAELWEREIDAARRIR